MLALDDVLVDLGTAIDVIGLDGEHFLQHVRRAVGFQCPHFHFTETLTTELSLTTQRLLRDERVRADRARMDLVVDKMMQLQDVDVADCDFAIEAGMPESFNVLVKEIRSLGLDIELERT